MSSKNPKYTQEYKQTIVNLYHSGKTYSEIHKEYGISHSGAVKKQPCKNKKAHNHYHFRLCAFCGIISM